MKLHVPPIKSQGIKTKLVPWINSIIPPNFNGRWIEPFMGTGVVGFNLIPNDALLSDTNPHLIKFYQAITHGEITPSRVKSYLIKEGSLLLEEGDSHYYKVRDRFNNKHCPLDFLFLNRAGFNGMIRFNRKGGLNTPFCRKPQRFAQAYITKITNQVAYISHILSSKKIELICQSFEKTIAESQNSDIIYCDPPYIDRHADYFNGWNETMEKLLFDALSQSKSKFILSTWHHNDFRKNKHIDLMWKEFNVLTREHFYHIGGSKKNRNPMIEALITNYDVSMPKNVEQKNPVQLVLFEQGVAYGV